MADQHRTAFAMCATSGTGGQQRLLALHGYRQNAAVFRAKTGAMRRALRGVAELVYIDAPHLSGDDGGRAWWHSNDDGSRYAGMQDSLEHIATTVEERGPFDGVLGFSQGAVFASLLAAHPTTRHHWRYSVLISGFPARDAAVKDADWYQVVEKPSLHVYGENDKLVPPQFSALLADRFASSQRHVHAGGHLPPFARPSTDVLTAFIEGFTLRSAPAAAL